VISTYEAIFVAVLAILPGAAYTFAYERVAGGYGLGFADRVIRFVAASAVLQAVFAGPTYLLYKEWISSGKLAAGRVGWVWFWAAALLYTLVPTTLGSFVGYARLKGWNWAELMTGSSPEPRAWDSMWNREVQAILRMKLKSGTWVGGLFATTPDGLRSYASGYPEDGDLHLVKQVLVDRITGKFKKSPDGTPQVEDRGLLIRWSEIEYIDIQEF
jgi:hypothetical protein